MTTTSVDNGPPPSSNLRQRTSRSSSNNKPSQTRSHSSHSHHGHGHSHSHSHGEEEAAALLTALSGSSDPGSRVTLIGLFSNIALTAVKGVAGYVLASAALMADAAHSGSDLLADIVTLTTYRMSRRPVSELYPYGYGKYESLGSLVVSFLLIGTALGIGLHSYHLLLNTLTHMPHLNINLSFLASLDAVLPHGHSHGPSSGSDASEEITDARAMIFAGSSILVKEWLYRITLKVAKEQHSNVLLANALHHRSDAFGSLVALGAIAGSWMGFPVLDPLGGLLVSGMILKNGAEVGVNALKELVDQVTDPTLPSRVHTLLLQLRDPSLPPLPAYSQTSSTEIHQPSAASSSSPTTPTTTSSTSLTTPPPSPPLSSVPSPKLPILSIPSIRIFSSGPSILVDIQIVLPDEMSLREVNDLERIVEGRVRELLGARVREVVVRSLGEEEGRETGVVGK
ncbi:cation efflux protein [Meredithblackwellia eburnea MCA 4105]